MTLQMSKVFSTSIGIIEAPAFLHEAKSVSERMLNRVKQRIKIDEVYPVVQTENMNTEPDLEFLIAAILRESEFFLDSQGYDLSEFQLVVGDLWCQEHHKYSGHDKHVHNNGAVVSGFYFLEVPENSSAMMFYDPRIGREYGLSLPEKNEKNLTEASYVINHIPTVGQMILANSFVPHGFEKNRSDKPFVLIHFNVYSQWVGKKEIPVSNNIEKVTYGGATVI